MENLKIYEDVLDSLLKGNRLACENGMKEFRKSNSSIIALYEEIFKKSLYEIGQRWECNKISVAVEHMATSITEGLMNQLFPEIMSPERKNKKVIISCVENEEHQIGGKMVADIFEKNGWDAHYLGANTPMNELVKFCGLVKPDMIGLSLSVYSNVHFLLEEIATIRTVTNIPIMIGGQALNDVGVELADRFTEVFYFRNLEAIESYIKGCA
ncbi:cobalamin B12-binding domain-containing protein [Desulfosporosinus hippei]|uniref:B12 binding domain-containing protein n=1 Tax=Desulfosporosinus hippei DSM 8344 TaxID=1121419 RepID=A0A1G7WBP8_9FIRM|nr:cobalamin-dependent protein [Desulfosporosinus hippei]SDG68550.1 B12 binding domain-containing protein [Desulfosporosinus hippei DSM 8344]